MISIILYLTEGFFPLGDVFDLSQFRNLFHSRFLLYVFIHCKSHSFHITFNDTFIEKNPLTPSVGDK